MPLADHSKANLEPVRAIIDELLDRSVAPYSGRPDACLALLSEGGWVPGVRVESASFSLVIPAVVNALSTAVAVERTDVVAIAFSRPAHPHEATYLEHAFPGPFERARDDLFVAASLSSFEELTEAASPFLDAGQIGRPADGIMLARHVAERAHVPESRYKVGCVFDLGNGRLVPGVNVEHADWTRTICAERNALGTAVSYGLGPTEAIYLSCIRDPDASPCGACRQLLSEFADSSVLWIDRGEAQPERTTTMEQLPASFTGATLRRNRRR